MSLASGTDLLAEANRSLPALSALRRDLHRHPELGGREFRTAGIVAERLRALGLEVRTGVGGAGVVGLLRARGATGADAPAAAVALRADIDALPVPEAGQSPYRSTLPGVSHACGHDGHTAIQLGAAELLHRHHEELAGNVLFLFQPSEETLPGGARAMIRDGALRDAGLRAILSLHLNPSLASGTAAARAGWATASSLTFHVQVTGRGGHVADPDRTRNPLLASALLLTAAEALRREMERDGRPLVLAFASMHAGDAANVVPETAELSGSLRAPSPEGLQRALKRFRDLIRSVAEPTGAHFDLDVEEGYPPVWNDPALTSRFCRAAASLLGPARVSALEKALPIGDDVSFFHREASGVYWQLGCGDPGRGFDHPLHSPRFDFDESLLALGAAVQARAAWELLGQEVSP